MQFWLKEDAVVEEKLSLVRKKTAEYRGCLGTSGYGSTLRGLGMIIFVFAQRYALDRGTEIHTAISCFRTQVDE